MMAHYSDKSVDYYQIDPEILASFKINSEEQLNTIVNRMESAFSQNN